MKTTSIAGIKEQLLSAKKLGDVADAFFGDVFDVGTAALERGDFQFIDIESNDAKAAFGELERER